MKRFLIIITLFLVCNMSYAERVELSKMATAFYSDNNNTKALDLILQINENDRTAQDWILLGNILADNNKFEDAAFLYRKAIVKDSKNYKAYYNLGNYYMDKGQFNMALETYKKALKNKSDNPYIHYNIGCAYMKFGKYSQARSSFNKAILYNSTVPEFHYNLAYVYKQLGKEKLAQTYLNNYNKLVSEN